MKKNIELYPLTHPQKAVWFTEKLHPDTSIGNIAGTLRIKENVNLTILEKAINIFIEKNDSMRIHIVEADGEPRQYLSEYRYYKLDFFDFSGKDINELYKWDSEMTRTSFDLIDSDLFYFALIKISDNDSGFYLKCHHLISDAWSTSLLGNQIMSYYSDIKKGIEVTAANNPSYLDYIEIENDYKNSNRMLRDKEYWYDIFKSFPGETALKEVIPDKVSTKARRKTMLTPKKLTAKINQYCAENNVSVFSLFIAALAMYINRITAKEDIVIGTTILNRLNKKEKETVGMFDNILPMRVSLVDNMDFDSLIESVSKEGLRLLRHQRYPYDWILRDARSKYKIAENIFNIILIFQNTKLAKDIVEEEYITRWHFNGHQVDSLHISINDRENEGCLIIDYDYQTDLFHSKEIEFIHQNLINVLWHALDNPAKEISRLEMLSEKEKHRILNEFNGTQIIYPEGSEYFFEKPVMEIPQNAKSYILDKNLNLMPIGIAGYLFVSGAGLEKDKLNEMGLSEDNVVPNPYFAGDILYNTGLKARWFPGGDILYLGAAGGNEEDVNGDNDNKGDNANKKEETEVDIISTFTAEPVERYIRWWGRKFGECFKVNFAGYNQVFQEFLNPDSILHENTDGINVALIRFEDYIRFDGGTDRDKAIKLDKIYGELKDALSKFAGKAPMIASVFPISTHLGLNDLLKDKIENINLDFKKYISEQKNVFLLDFEDLQELYGINKTFDYLQDKEGHMPFTEEYYAAIGTEIARKIIAIKKQLFKVIVLDCDNTLWNGICGELGAAGVQITEPYKHLQQFMLRKYNEGMLLAVCSKNNEEDVFEVFEENPGMVLNKNHIINWKVNWNEKSDNIKEVAQELNLGLDSFIFIDDDPLECSKMAERCPEVLTLQLPRETSHIPVFLKHVWAFDTVRVTREDALRNRMYEAEVRRKEFKHSNISLESFKKNLCLKVSMRAMAEDETERASQLTQRTNQYNLSTIRRNEDEITKLAFDSNYMCFVVEASDRFGDYGIIGLAILKNDNDKLLLDTFLMSCRINGRNVEDVMLAGIGRYARENREKVVEAVYVPTEKNKPIYEFIKRIDWRLIDDNGNNLRYVIKTEDLPENIDFIEFYYNEKYKGNPDRLQTVEMNLSNSEIACTAEVLKENSSTESFTEFYDTELIKNVKHKEYIEPFNYLTGRSLLHIAYSGADAEAGINASGNKTQQKLKSIWSSLLNILEIDEDDSFFKLGGDSLTAVILISRINKEFGVELTLKDIFRYNTIAKLSEKIDKTGSIEYDCIEPSRKRDYYELSSAQKRMYVLNKIEKDQTGYNECHRIDISGNLDIQGLECAISKFIDRHEILRTGFEMAEERPVQKVYNVADFKIPCRKIAHDEINDAINKFVKPFDLSKPPLIRAELLETGKDSHILLLDIHHIIIDGTSFGIMIKEIQALYEGKYLEPLDIHYKDFASWQNVFLKSEKIKKQEEYWLGQFNDEIPVLNLPTDHQRPAMQSFNGKKRYFSIDSGAYEQLRFICDKTETTLFMLLFAAYNVLLYRYTGQEDIVVGTPVSGRRHPQTENIVGMFVNTLPIRTFPRGEISFCGYMKNVKEAVLMALQNQDYQYEVLLEKLNVKRELNRNPLFDVTFTLQNTQGHEISIGGLAISNARIDNHKSKFDISLLAEERNGGLEFELEYSMDLFEDETIERLEGHFLNILSAVSENQDILISDIEIMGEEEKNKILYEFNDTECDYPKDKTVHQLFEEQAERTPDNIAVVFEDKQLTYKELNAKANQLARTLRDKGVKPDTVVGIMVERSLEMIIGILAILKAGGAYLPIDPEYPEERIKYMLENSGAKILLYKNTLNRNLEIDICIELEMRRFSASTHNLENISLPTNLAYIIYTSGSTGNPKGVMIEHHSVINRIVWMQKRYPINQNSVILQKTTYTFDVSVWELFWWSFIGAKLCLLKPQGEKDPSEIIRAIKKYQITTIHFVPSMLNLFLKYIQLHTDFKELASLNQVFCSGEALNTQHVNLFYDLLINNDTLLINLYGPTEATVDVSYFDCNADKKLENIPIGKPIDNTKLYIFGRNNLQPIGIPGELYIGGAGLARGYINNDKLTDERFIINPNNSNERLYKTGDLAKWNSEGDIEYLGRLDFQVKIRGFRVELSEIETLLLKYKDIKEAVASVEIVNGSQILYAYIVSENEIDASDLKVFLSRKLPGYMVPSRFIAVDKIPLLTNGKINRKELFKASKSKHIQKANEKPEGEVQEILYGIFRDILNLDIIDIDESFFELGGDSLQTIKLTLEIYEKFDIEINYIDIHNNPTINNLSIFISNALLNGFKKDIDIGSIYILLNEKKNKSIYAFPPITGFGLAFNEMSKYINNYSLYAFNYITDENKLERYANIIKQNQPNGPYILLGFSAGAHIVLELSKMLNNEELVIILMDGFYGDIGENDVDNNINFFINYSKQFANLNKENKFINDILEDRIKDYMYYVADNTTKKVSIDKDIYFIQSEEMTDSDMEEIKNITSKSFFKYKAIGKHFDLLKPGYIENNSKLVESILDEYFKCKL